jgi:Rrf2 family nitric oxide-sensitive transcriptional repressor
MQLTKHTDFALRCLMYLAALPEGQLATITEIAEQFNIPRNHLMKVVHQLGKLGYVTTLRGPKGGICLKKDPSDILLSTLVKDFEVRLDPINCDTPPCPMNGGCELKHAMLKAQQAFLNALDNYTVASLVKNPGKLVDVVLIE